MIGRLIEWFLGGAWADQILRCMRASYDALRISVVRSKDAFEIGRHRIGVRHSQFMEPFPERANRGPVLLARSAKNIVAVVWRHQLRKRRDQAVRAQLALDQKSRGDRYPKPVYRRTPTDAAISITT